MRQLLRRNHLAVLDLGPRLATALLGRFPINTTRHLPASQRIDQHIDLRLHSVQLRLHRVIRSRGTLRRRQCLFQLQNQRGKQLRLHLLAARVANDKDTRRGMGNTVLVRSAGIAELLHDMNIFAWDHLLPPSRFAHDRVARH